MNKQNNSEIRKTLIRNYEKTVPRSRVEITNSVAELKSDIKGKATPEGTTERRIGKTVVTDCNDLGLPELHSTLKLSKKIDCIIEPRKAKSCSDVDKKKLALDEKVSRRVNFPYDQPVYKDLIPLNCEKALCQPVVSLRGPLPQRDKEPVLLDFIEPQKGPLYYYLPNVKNESKVPKISCNNLRLYKMVKMSYD